MHSGPWFDASVRLALNTCRADWIYSDGFHFRELGGQFVLRRSVRIGRFLRAGGKLCHQTHSMRADSRSQSWSPGDRPFSDGPFGWTRFPRHP